MNYIDIFAGCGGLSEGFESNSSYNMLAAVEWEKPQVDNLRNHLRNNYNMADTDERVIHFDIQRTNELINGWINDSTYGSHIGLKKLIGENTVDLIIGGPPCQAYSIAGRISDSKNMINDYRNFLFESYIHIVKNLQPKLFVFENVPGMLSAKPDGKTLVTDLIRSEFKKNGYEIIDDLRKYAQFDLSEYGIPQKRKRVIIVGIRRDIYSNYQEILENFYTKTMPNLKENAATVQKAIGDLPKFFPLTETQIIDSKKTNHSYNFLFPNHFPRFHSKRDISIFKLLAEDIESNTCKYISTTALRDLYTLKTGKSSNVHKYHVLRLNQPSNTIPAHLYKDGLRHIHPDSKQARTITVREAARLQTFPDSYTFISSQSDNYKMIGNAVPPKFSTKLSTALLSLLN